MIPEFTEDGFLPEGIHRATLSEFEERFVVSPGSFQRRKVFRYLRDLVKEATNSGIVKRLLVGGSFVTAKSEPNDFDCVIVLDRSVFGRALRPFEYRLASKKLARRAFKGDAIPVVEGTAAFRRHVEFFQSTRGGLRVGMVAIEL